EPAAKGPSMVKPGAAAQSQSHFAWLRTRLSVERTLLSWVRTGAAMIGFGFTIFEFFEHLNQMQGVARPLHPGSARIMSLALVAIGTLALLVALNEYRRMIGYLWSEEFREFAGVAERPLWTPAFTVGAILALVGAGTLVALVVRTVLSTR